MTDPGACALDDQEALALLAFLLASAEGCLREPPLYGVFRLGTAAARLAGAWAPRAQPETAAMLRDLVARWEREGALLTQDTQQLKRYLEASVVAVAQEIQRREPRGRAS